MYDHSVRVPLFVNGPNVPKDKRIETPAYLQDIMASSLDLAGIQKPDHMDFNSLIPIISGDKEKNYDLIYGGYMELQRMVTDGDFKLIHYPKIDKTILYNLKDDPLEMTNLADDPLYANKVQELRQKLHELQVELNDPLVVS
jgi:choline-sulfatase